MTKNNQTHWPQQKNILQLNCTFFNEDVITESIKSSNHRNSPPDVFYNKGALKNCVNS